MMKKLLCALVVLTAVPALAQEKQEDVRVRVYGPGAAAPMPPAPPAPPMPPEPPLAPPSFGIPADVAAKIGLPQNLVQKVQDLSFESNDALIGLEADLKRAQLALEKELRQPTPNEGTVKDLVEKVGRAETAVRQNRVGLMVAIKKTLGPDYWQKLEAEMGPMGMGVGPHRIRIQRRVDDVRGAPGAPAAPGQPREERKP
ncbi:periplasmic heavy metal sensor [Archangium lansingense]|uniref:Periplasmic heavy metal sensor n=1 Tax=Archangium lansingense TaxID=2995310 RepID=A0ABT4A722_9BACT|nr:periplasmic heavy metal sensor [Archangium lansinium]MCY1077458.1 periplasmic heavy metal sensor [Archangium lansinium]